MQVILEYTDDDYKRLEERAFINSRTVGEYIRKNVGYPCDSFKSWQVVDNATPDVKPAVEPLKTDNGDSVMDTEPELYVSDKPKVVKKRKYKVKK